MTRGIDMLCFRAFLCSLRVFAARFHDDIKSPSEKLIPIRNLPLRVSSGRSLKPEGGIPELKFCLVSVRKLRFEANGIARSEERTTKQSLGFQESASLLLLACNDGNIPIGLVSGRTLLKGGCSKRGHQ
ncbi:MAG: hypothetical protein B1H02_00280 [Candidatus Latescibacteria bacterium 4484_107]|nr:MAG: hypothetical protein B1H02_00280 [Candidatus Latescibacteria bacterium 4484_107]